MLSILKLMTVPLLACGAAMACGGAPGGVESSSPPSGATSVVPPTNDARPTAGPSQEPAQSALSVRPLAQGEELTATLSGAIFLDTTTGSVELVTLLPPAEHPFFVSADNRFVYVDAGDGLLLDRVTGKVWDGDQLPGRPVTSGGDLLSTAGRLVVETRSTARTYSVLDAELHEVARFDLGENDDEPLKFWAPDNSAHAVLFDGAFRTLDLDDGTIGTVMFGAAAGSITGAHALDEGFSLTSVEEGDRQESEPRCTVALFSWDGSQPSVADLQPCSGSNLAGRFAVAPDGTQVAMWVPLAVQEGAGPGYNPIPGAVYVFDARTGKPSFRVKGTALPLSFGNAPLVWLDDGSALVVSTRAGNLLVGSSGDWRPDDVPGYFPFPAANDPAWFGASGPGKTPGRSSGASVIERLGLPLDSVRAWGVAGHEVRYSILPLKGDWGGVAPVASPAIELPPFGTDQLVVDLPGGCLTIHVQPDEAEASVACLPDGASVAIQTVPLSEITTGPHEAAGNGPLYSAYWRPAETCEGDGVWCLWVSVRAPSGAQGWALAEYLKWPGVEPTRP